MILNITISQNSNITTPMAIPVVAHVIAMQVVYIVCGFIMLSIRLDYNIDCNSMTTFSRAVCSGIYMTISTYILLPEAIFSSCVDSSQVIEVRFVALSTIWLALYIRYYTNSITRHNETLALPSLTDIHMWHTYDHAVLPLVILDILYRLADIAGLLIVLYFWPPIIAWLVLVASLLRVISLRCVRPYTLGIFIVTSVGGFMLILVLLNISFSNHQFANLLVFTSVINICMVYDIFIHMEPISKTYVTTSALVAVVFTVTLCLAHSLKYRDPCGS